MAACDQFQSQLLDHLYDLLDADESRALRDHLAVCPSCQVALKQAQAHRRLLAVAALDGFPGVRFTVPAAEREQPSARAFGRPRWAGWAVAAAVLLAVAGVGGPAGVWSLNHRGLERQAEAARTEYDQATTLAQNFDLSQRNRRQEATDEAAAAQKDLFKAQRDYNDRLTKLQHAVKEQQLRVSITGPATLQPGAPNPYQVQVQDLNQRPTQATLTVFVRDQDRKVVWEQHDVDARGTHTLTLPAGLPLGPNGQLALEVFARRPNGPTSQLRAELPLAAPLYVTHLTTDKPMYQPGETVHFRSLTLERFSLKPPQDTFQLVYTITNPLGAEIFRHQGVTLLADPVRSDATLALGPDRKPVRGVGAGDWAIGPELPGGEYVLTVKEAGGRFPDQQRKFLVNRYQKPRLNKELDFNRKSYGPGDEVQAACKVKRAEGGAAVANHEVTATVNIDGKTYGADGNESTSPLRLRTDAEGKVTVRFKLPTAIERGQATLNVVFSDGASTEPLNKPIPIVLKKLNVEFFPEGGDLVAGVPSRVYFQVRTTLDKPAELTGRVVDDTGKVVVEKVETLNDDQEPGVNQGMGVFKITPQDGGRYELKIDTPRGLEGRYGLPPVKKEGVVLEVVNGVVRANETLTLAVNDPKSDQELLVGAYCRGRLIDHVVLPPSADLMPPKGGGEYGVRPVRFDLKGAPGGVYRITVFEKRKGQDGRETLRPLAERLVYRLPAEQLNLSVKPAKDRYVPGDSVTLGVEATTENKAPAPAVLLLAVVDKSVVTMADEKTARTMPTHFFLTTEVRKPEDLEYADFLLGKHPKAPAALDLLLGTQGWRRFAEQDPAKFKQEHQTEADRLLAVTGLSPKPSGDLGEHEQRQAHAELGERTRQAAERHEKAQQAWTAADADEQQRPERLQAQMTAQERHLAAIDAVDAHRATGVRYRTLALWVLLPLLLAGAGISLLLAILRNLPRAMPYYAVSAVCMLLVLVGAAFLQLGGDPAAGGVRATVAGQRGQAVTATDAPVPATSETKTASTPWPQPDATGWWEGRFGGGAPGADGLGNRSGRGGAGPQPTAPGAGMPAPPALRPLAEMQPGGAPADPARQFMLQRPQAEKGAAPADGRANLRQPAEEQKRGDKKDAPAPRREEMERLAGGRRAGIARDQDDRRMPEADGVRARGAPAAAATPPLLGGPAAGGRMGFGGEGMADKAIIPPQPLVVREYAHRRQSSATPDVRRDFTETLYWHPVLVLPDGKGQVSFDLCDSVTTFQVAAVGHTLDGRLGSVTATLESRKPFTLEPKVPLEVTADDKIDVAVSVANNTTANHTAVVRVQGEGLKLLKGQQLEELPLGADQRKRLVYRFQPDRVEGAAQLYLEGGLAGFDTDKVLHTFQVVPQGFPVIGAHSDMLEKSALNTVELPQGWLKGTLKARVEVYPSTLADLQKGLAGLLREPNGCFEQTSTSNYPNLLILDYLKETDQALPEVESRAREMLGRGYQRLTAYECPYTGKGRNGFEWFGAANSAHEALTAYGLMQFRDMARVQEVDPALIERTRQWLLARKDGKGGFQRNPRALDTFGRAPEDVTNAYIVWALTESGKDDDVTRELDRLHEQAKASKDPYFLSLVANSLLNRSRPDDGVALLKKVAEAQKADGHLDAGSTSITGSGGRDLQIETTALAVYGWLKANRPADFTKPVQAAVKWIGQQRGGRGGFGSTQSTILALKALIAFAKANKKTPEAGEVTLFVGDQKVAELKFPASAAETLALEVPEAEKHLKAGKNAVRVEITGKNVFPYTLSWSYQTLQPLSADKAPVKLETRLDRSAADEGDGVRLTAVVENVSGQGQGMAVAILGLPAGLAVPEDMKQLKDHVRVPADGSRPLVSAFEVRGRELVLYWRDLAAGQKIEVPIDLVCRVPGEYSGPASRAYLYYNADHKHWVEPLKVAIAAKAE